MIRRLRHLLCLFIPLVTALKVFPADPPLLRPYPGITYRAEVRPDPPMHLFIAEVDLANPKIRVRVTPAGPDPDGAGEWETTLMRPSKIAAREGFELTVNGDFFLAHNVKDAEGMQSQYRSDVWAAAIGPAVTDGKVWSSGKKKRPCLIVHKNRRVTIESIDRPPSDAWEVVSGNVMLVEKGQPVPQANKTKHPRTVAGLDAKGTTLTLLVVDGRNPDASVGMSYAELAKEMIRLGCQQAINLDGGGSSAMVLRDPKTRELKVLNEPSDGHERAVANVLGIAVADKLDEDAPPAPPKAESKPPQRPKTPAPRKSTKSSSKKPRK